MNLTEFTDLVDQKVEELSQSDLLYFIHQIVRKVPEVKRLSFLALLENMPESDVLSGETGDLRAKIKKANEIDVNVKLTRLEGLFQKISDGVVLLYAEPYEDDSDGWQEDWFLTFEDPENTC